MKTFTEKTYEVVRNIPRGEVLTYAQVARRVGNPKASRAIGTLMRKNYNPDIPCHRVVRSDGKIGGYNRGGAVKKTELLIQEGCEFSKRGTLILT